MPLAIAVASLTPARVTDAVLLDPGTRVTRVSAPPRLASSLLAPVFN